MAGLGADLVDVTRGRWTSRDALNSLSLQVGLLVVAVLVMAVRHHANDGLWFQGDSPRHAMNGLFWWDLLGAMPVNPLDFTLRYYARYPAISPATYPPLFAIIEGAAFALFGTSPYVARGLVLLFGVAAAGYTMAWARRWIAPAAGWTGVFLALTPAIVVWSNSVMLNIPALALALATLYHCRRWIESTSLRQLQLTAVFALATLGTYYQATGVLVICAVWVLVRRREIHAPRQLGWLAILAVCGILPVVATCLIAPVQIVRHLPSVETLRAGGTWSFYWLALPQIISWAWLTVAVSSLASGIWSTRWRREVAYLVGWIVALLVPLSLVTATDSRYILLAIPAVILLAAVGLQALAERFPSPDGRRPCTVLLASLTVAGVSAWRTTIPRVDGFREVAEFLKVQGPRDAVFYDGSFSGVFVYHVRANDPDFERRVMLGSKLLYSIAPRSTFKPVNENYVSSVEDVIDVLRRRSGCRWVAIQHSRKDSAGTSMLARRLLLEAVARPEFSLVRSFTVTANGVRRIDLYRLEGPLLPVTGVDLQFPNFLADRFTNVVPITRHQ